MHVKIQIREARKERIKRFNSKNCVAFENCGSTKCVADHQMVLQCEFGQRGEPSAERMDNLYLPW